MEVQEIHYLMLHCYQLGSIEPPKENGTGGPSYGAPLSQTVKWPTSGGGMGGFSLLPL